ncbi:hypothetical protein [Bacillus atrophaeus]|uniref:hypothetical protein n=1 Tax=Bacillus atrophaeus TaxID=1452 RepID=UPI002E1CC5B1|nr:hypothetical protein [Bacillus atrophaeus]
MEKMTVHRALTELKTLDARINSAIDDGIYITANKRSNQKIDGLSVDDHKKAIQGSYDKVIGLIERRNKIKAAIVESNAKTIVTVAGNDMTVAAAIERKTSIGYEDFFLNKLKAAYVQATGKVNRENESLPHKLETYLHSVIGSKEQAKQEEVEFHTKTFTERNEYELIDPMGLKERINKLEEETYEFKAEVDAALSESNAVTFIFDKEEAEDQ